MTPVYDRSMDDRDFVLRVRGARQTRLFRFRGAEAAELHRLRESGSFERPGGTRHLNDLIGARDPDEVVDGASTPGGAEAHFEMVADDELRGYLSNRLLERKGAAEGGGGSQGARNLNVDPPNTPSRA